MYLHTGGAWLEMLVIHGLVSSPNMSQFLVLYQLFDLLLNLQSLVVT